MRHRNTRSRAMIVMATALTFVLAGSTVAFAETGDATDQAEHRDHAIDRLKDRHRDRIGDRPIDRPTDRPKDRPDRDRRPAIWKRCLAAAEADAEVTDVPPEFRKICHRILWRHRAWQRCLRWAAEHLDVRPDNRRELWRLCHRALWDHTHARPQ